MQPSVFTVSLLILAALHGVHAHVGPNAHADEDFHKGALDDPVLLDQMWPVYDGATERAFCVDLTDTFANMPNTDMFRYKVTKPLSGSRCRQQGIVYVKEKPDWATSLSIHMEFERPRDHTFNIGDQSDADGFGGSQGPRYHNAEIFSDGYRVRAYTNKGSRSKKFFDKKVAKKVLFIRLYKAMFYVTDYSSYGDWVFPKPGIFDKFFWFHGSGSDPLYIGLNRVIHHINGDPNHGRDGRGLCNICMWWNH